MSGITALFRRDGSDFDADRLDTMQTALSHRGPDGSDTWFDGHIGLGHQYLQSTPESDLVTQPYSEGDLVISADLRVDNREELQDQIGISTPVTQVADSELLLEAYKMWGTDCVKHIAGAYAFVIWDRNRSHLFCARDRLGVKPFYYYHNQDTFAMASEKKGLLTLPAVPHTVDETKIGDFLIAMYEDKSRSFFESITRLPPATAMTVTSDSIDRWQYWDLDPSRTVTLSSDAAYERRFRELFTQAVQCRLRGEQPIGTTLSGGMDSSSITVMARDLLPGSEDLHTFSNVYDEAPTSDEREFIETVIDRPGITSHYSFPEGIGSLVDEDELRAYLDQPPHNTMHFAVWERTKLAADTGVKAVLGGELGDSAVGYGLGLLPELFWTGRWLTLYAELQAMADIVEAPVSHLFKRHVLSEVVPEPVLRLRQRGTDATGPLASENPTVKKEFANRINLETRYTEMRPKGAWFTPRARGLQYRSLVTGRNATNFEALDLVHAAFGVEPRYPFTDHRLLEYTLAIPPTQQFADGWTRSLIRRSLGDLLPDKIQWRPWKTGVNEAFWNALQSESKRLGGLCCNSDALTQYVDTEKLATALNRFNNDRTAQDARALWRALSLSVWMDEYDAITSME